MERDVEDGHFRERSWEGAVIQPADCISSKLCVHHRNQQEFFGTGRHLAIRCNKPNGETIGR